MRGGWVWRGLGGDGGFYIVVIFRASGVGYSGFCIRFFICISDGGRVRIELEKAVRVRRVFFGRAIWDRF